MSEAASSSLPEYKFRENQDLQKLDAKYIDTAQLSVIESNTALYTEGCSTCSALIITVKLEDGKIFHGMYHAMHVYSSKKIENAFNKLMNGFGSIKKSMIDEVKYYLITTPEFKDKRIRDTQYVDFPVTIFSPNVKVTQLDDSVEKRYEDDDIENLLSGIDVKLSYGVIEVKYE